MGKEDLAQEKEAEEAKSSPIIGSMYARWTLDCVVEVAYLVSNDFVKRPRHYRNIPYGINDIMSDFRARTGSDPDWPNAAQRTAIYSAFLGDSDGKPKIDQSTPFHGTVMGLRDAAVAYSERVYDTGEAMLRQAFIDAAIACQAYLTTLEGSVLRVGNVHTQSIFDNARELLLDENVARSFGLQPAKNGTWPFSTYDGNGAYLIEEITRALSSKDIGTISQQKFVVLQRSAHYGSMIINWLSCDYDISALTIDDIGKLIKLAYSWETAIRVLRKT